MTVTMNQLKTMAKRANCVGYSKYKAFQREELCEMIIEKYLETLNDRKLSDEVRAEAAMCIYYMIRREFPHRMPEARGFARTANELLGV